MKNLADVLKELKAGTNTKTEREKSLFVEDWDCIVKVRSLTLNDFIFSEDYGFSVNDNGEKVRSENKKEIILVCLAVQDLEYPRDVEFLEQTAKAGTVKKLLNEIMLFSGFNSDINELIESKKKA